MDFLSWHNSEVRCVIPRGAQDGQARVMLSVGAVLRQADGANFKSGLPGYIQHLELVFEQAHLIGPIDDCLGGIAQGDLRLTSMRAHSAAQVPLPWHCTEPLTLSLQFRNGSQLLIEARAAHCTPSDEATFIESYAC
ncbi:hypothetical protein [Aquabacterium sp.]|uniref:hypothetical protein n=1 Tax=Aquabacterium sp. TaxID=1872578 RepID=UPI0025BE4FB9|nr:hypothetical protein [Aquabacterium sp.]